MGLFFEFDAMNNVLRGSWTGPLTDEILLEGYSLGGRLLASRPSCRGINDLSGVTTFGVANETIRRLAEMPPVFGGASLGVIVASKDLIFGMARMFSILGEESRPHLRVVHTMEEAYELLGIASPQFSRIEID